MVELRKRKAPSEPQPPLGKKTKSIPKSTKVKAAEDAKEPSDNTATQKAVPKVGDVLSQDEFGGAVETQDGNTTSLKALIDSSDSGVVLFTYPKASTPGCKSIHSSLLLTAFHPSTPPDVVSVNAPNSSTFLMTCRDTPIPDCCYLL